MSSSAITGNITGFASDTSPGLVSTGTQTFAGAKTFSDGIASDNINIIDSSPLSYRNRVINGDMRIAQRGIQTGASASSLSNSFCIDRFSNYSFTGTARVQQTSITNLSGFNKALRYTVGSASSRHLTTTRFEGYNVSDLVGKQVTISFWIRGSKFFTFGWYCYVQGVGQSLVKNVSVTTEWQKISITFTMYSSIGSLIEGNAFESVFNWYPDSTSLTASELTWVSGDKQGTTGTTYGFNTASDWVEITGVQLELGNKSTAFERRPIGIELPLCQRYFEKSYDLNDAIGSVNYQNFALMTAHANNSGRAILPFKAEKRTASPVIVLYSYSGTENKISSSAGGMGDTGTVLTASGRGSYINVVDSGTGFTVGALYYVGWTANAEM